MAASNHTTLHYDLSLLNELDDDEYVKEVIAMFLKSAPLQLAEIKQAIESADWESVYQKAHKLKSSIGLLKMDILYRYIGEIEQDARERANLPSIENRFKSVLSEYAAASTLLEKEIR